MLWAVFTLIAAAAQTARNAMQRELTATLGTVGATHVRFLFGFPFALLFLAGVLIATGEALRRLIRAHGRESVITSDGRVLPATYDVIMEIV